jgi:hypothetical protein
MNGNQAVRRTSMLAVTAVTLGGFVLGTGGPAAAYTAKNGKLESSEFGLYYYSGQGGCVFDIAGSDNDFADDRFKDPYSANCAGEGQTTNDNTASYWNRATYTYYVWTDHYQEGTRGSLPGGYSGNSSSTFKNEISSSSYIIH